METIKEFTNKHGNKFLKLVKISEFEYDLTITKAEYNAQEEHMEYKPYVLHYLGLETALKFYEQYKEKFK